MKSVLFAIVIFIFINVNGYNCKSVVQFASREMIPGVYRIVGAEGSAVGHINDT
jgi:hypothetical protein